MNEQLYMNDDLLSEAARSGERVRLMLVGPDPELRRSLRDRLAHSQWCIREALSGSDALEQLMEEACEVMLVEAQLPDLHPDEFRSMVRTQFPDVQILTAGASPASQLCPAAPSGHATAVWNETLQLGRFSLGLETPRSTFSYAPPVLDCEPGWQGLIGTSSAMQRVYHAARLVARRDTTVLILGESGTGKDLVARAIHTSGSREKQPFVVINCAAIPEQLLEAELFGYTKGAFTGATQSRIGRIHAAHGGTLFLDEIGDMPYPLQSKILRFLEQGEVQRIGGTDTLKVDCRVIAATNVHLKTKVKEHLFREDLYYRLAVFPIQLPPLRERMEDMNALIASFLQRFCPGLGLQPAARQVLKAHDWPGNVRELRNVLERASLFAESRREICPEDIVL